MLKEGCSKAEEMAHWRQFLADLPPASYLALYLAETEELLEWAMANDMSVSLVKDSRRRQVEAEAEARQAEARLQQLLEQNKMLDLAQTRLKREGARLREELRKTMEYCQTLSREAAEAYAKAVKAAV